MADAPIRVSLCWSSRPRQVQVLDLDVPEGSTVATVLAQAIAQKPPQALADGQTEPAPLTALAFQTPGIWGRKVPWAHVVQNGDRIELYRPLVVDPKVARRQRFKRQGKGRTGLFANRKSGSAAGY